MESSSDIPRLGCAARLVRRGETIATSEQYCERPLWSHHPAEQTDLLRQKFQRLVEPVLGRTTAEQLERTILALECLPDARLGLGAAVA